MLVFAPQDGDVRAASPIARPGRGITVTITTTSHHQPTQNRRFNSPRDGYRHKEEQLKGGVAEVEARELALKGKFDQCAFTSSPQSTFSDGDRVPLDVFSPRMVFVDVNDLWISAPKYLGLTASPGKWSAGT